MQAQKFNEAQLKNFEQRVRHYCSLLEDFSSSTDGVLVMDELKACCENENVSTFDDLLADNRQVEYNSVPLSGYLMKITSKFDHKLKVSYSNFKYESCVTHPALVKELDDITYARFSCTKTIKGKGVSFMENNAGWHGKAPNDEQYAQAKAEVEAKLAELEGK